MTRWTDVESTPVDAITVGGETEKPVRGVASGIVMARMIDESADATDLRILIVREHRRDPGLRQANVVVEERDDVALRHRETIVSRPRSAKPERKLGNAKLEASAKFFAYTLHFACRIRLHDQNDFESTIRQLGLPGPRDKARVARFSCMRRL